jgi:integrase
LSSILASAVEEGLLAKNTAKGIRLPPDKKGRPQRERHISPEQFDLLVREVLEPYATMMFVAVYSGLRVSELVGLRWNDIHADAITIDERFCRGNWAEPKSRSSNATIGVDRSVIERIHRLKLLTVEVKAGRAKRRYKVVKSAGPEDLVFQSVKDGRPMRDNNILTRFIKPAARRLGIGFVNWRTLRTSYATWLVQANADPKSVQGQMRHSRISTTMDIYAQFVPESQRRAVEKLTAMVTERRYAQEQALRQFAEQPSPSQTIN